MKAELKKRIPKLPQWRWVVSCIDSGRSISIPDQYINEFNSFYGYIKENYEDTEDAIGLIDVFSDSAEEVLNLNKVKPVRNVIRRMLSEKASPESICEVLDYKFRINTSTSSIEMFKSLFWDIDNVNTYEMAIFLHSLGESEVVPPTIGKYRKSYTEFSQGVDVVLDPKDILRHMMNRAFFRSEELFKTGNDMLAIRAQRAAMDIAKNLRLFNPDNVEESLSDIFEFRSNDVTEELQEDEDVEIPEHIINRG